MPSRARIGSWRVERAVQRVCKVDLQRQRHLRGGTATNVRVCVVAALRYVRVHLVIVGVRVVAPVREPSHPHVLVAIAVGGDVCPIVLWAQAWVCEGKGGCGNAGVWGWRWG